LVNFDDYIFIHYNFYQLYIITINLILIID